MSTDNNTITSERAQELLDGTTPGPWVEDEEFGYVVPSVGDRNTIVCSLDDENVRDTDGADIRLIAAAPDLARAVIALEAERDTAIRSLAACLRCDECGACGMRRHADGAIGCDAHGVGEGWTDLPHAAAVRATGEVRDG